MAAADPYRLVLRSLDSGPERGEELEALPSPAGTLRDSERFGLLRANEWVASGVCENVAVHVVRVYADGREREARVIYVYVATKGRLRGRVVGERVS